MDAPEITTERANAAPDGFMFDSKGNLIAEANVKAQDKLMDQTVRTIVSFASDLSAQIARFKGHTYDDIETFVALLRDEHGIEKSRSHRGDITLTSFDGLMKVTVSTQDNIGFGPELQVAKEQLDVLIDEWSEGASDQLRALTATAFDTSKAGNVNRDAIIRLRRLEFHTDDGEPDPRWRVVQGLITDSIRSVGSKSYVRIHTRETTDGAWTLLPLNLAKV